MNSSPNTLAQTSAGTPRKRCDHDVREEHPGEHLPLMCGVVLVEIGPFAQLGGKTSAAEM